MAVRSETKRLNTEVEELAKARADVHACIAEKQKKVSALEIESSTLTQTLDLLQQEMASISQKLKDKRSYYKSTLEDLSVKLQAQQDWFNSYKKKNTANNELVNGSLEQINCIKEKPDNATLSVEAIVEDMGEEACQRYKGLMAQLESKRAKLEELMSKKSKIALDSRKLKHLLEQMKYQTEGVPPEVKIMDEEALEEEHKSLMADNTGETEYLQSLQDQIKQMKEFSDVIMCRCGAEYKVELKI